MVFWLSVEKAQQILFRSFLLSQGDGTLQSTLLDYLAGTQPAWRLDEAVLPDLQKAAQRACWRFLESGWHQKVVPTTIVAEVANYVDELFQTFQGNAQPVSPLLLSDLIRDVIQRDYTYLVTKGGRPGRGLTPSSCQFSPAAPYFSHFVQYALLHRSTGMAEFDALFAAVGQAFTTQDEAWRLSLAKPAARRRIWMALEAHNTHYPTCPIPYPAGLSAPSSVSQEEDHE